MYAVVFNWYLIHMFVRSGVLGVVVVMHELRLLDERYIYIALICTEGNYSLHFSEFSFFF